MLATAGAVVGLWAGATRYSGPVARGYRWLGGAALFWCVGLIVDSVLAGPLSSSARAALAGGRGASARARGRRDRDHGAGLAAAG